MSVFVCPFSEQTFDQPHSTCAAGYTVVVPLVASTCIAYPLDVRDVGRQSNALQALHDSDVLEGFRRRRNSVRYMRIENSFIPVRGVGERTERSLWEEGVLTWDEFEPSVVGGQRGDRIRSSSTRDGTGWPRPTFLFRPRFPAASAGDCTRPSVKDLLLRHRDDRTGPDRNQVTTVILHPDGDTQTLIAGDDLTAGNLRAAFDGADLLVTFNGKRFDVPFLEANFTVLADEDT